MTKHWYTVAEALQFTADQVAPLPKSGGHRLYARSDWFPPDTVVGHFIPIRFSDDAGWFPPGVFQGVFCPLGKAFTPVHFKTAEESLNNSAKDMHWLTLSSMVERGQLTLRTPVARAPLRELSPYSSMKEFENYLLSEPEMRTFCAEFGIVLPAQEVAKPLVSNESAAPIPKQRRQEQKILYLLTAQGIAPLRLPARERGKEGTKAAIKRLALLDRQTFTSSSFEKAWGRMRKAKEIVGAD